MIHWLNPSALAGLALLGLPILIHLLRTRQAERIPFPSLRFVVPSETAAVRLRLPADWLLLLVRLVLRRDSGGAHVQHRGWDPHRDADCELQRHPDGYAQRLWRW